MEGACCPAPLFDQRVAIAKTDHKKSADVHFQPQHVVFVTKPPVQDVMQLLAQSTCVCLSLGFRHYAVCSEVVFVIFSREEVQRDS